VPRTLTITNRLLSIRGRMAIVDDSGQTAYEAHGSFALLRPTWRISKGSREVASIRRKIVSFTSTWKIKGELGTFVIRRKLFAWRHRYKAIGGPFDGATLNSNIWDLQFVIRYRDAVLAHASGTLLTLRDRQTIHVALEGDAAELFTVIAMVALHLDHRDEKRRREQVAKESR
jgi:uncharacterized protein YxjI